MNADELKALQAPIKDRYRKEPQAALITLRAQGLIGGSGLQACSGDMLFEALVACAGATLKSLATAIGVTLKDAQVFAEGDLDFRGTRGIAKDAPVGFRDIRLQFDLDADASAEQKKKLIELTERYCVVLQTQRPSPAVRTQA